MRAEVEATREALAAGLELARRAGRDARAPLAISAAGWTAVFVAGRATLPADAASALGWTGLALVLLMTPPKLGALHRLAAGAEVRDPVGPSGLQWTAVEGRMAATATALVGGAALVFAGLGLAAAGGLLALRSLGRVEATPAGPLSVGFLLLSPLLLAALAWAASTVGRFSVTLAAEAAEARPRFARGWLLTRGAVGPAAAVWILTSAAPLVGLLAAPGALDGLAGEAGGRWSVPEALAAGGALGAAAQFLFAPLNVGALAQLRRAGLAREAAEGVVDRPGTLGDKARAAPVSAPSAEPFPT